MVKDGGAPDLEDDMLPDEREVLPERGEQLDGLPEDELLTVEEVAENLDLSQD